MMQADRVHNGVRQNIERQKREATINRGDKRQVLDSHELAQ